MQEKNLEKKIEEMIQIIENFLYKPEAYFLAQVVDKEKPKMVIPENKRMVAIA
jgi:hypothetical protein